MTTNLIVSYIQDSIWKKMENLLNFRVEIRDPVEEGLPGVYIRCRIDNHKITPIDKAKKIEFFAWIEKEELEHYEFVQEIAEDLATKMVHELFKNLNTAKNHDTN